MIQESVVTILPVNDNVSVIKTRKLTFHIAKIMSQVFQKYNTFKLDLQSGSFNNNHDGLPEGCFLMVNAIVIENNDTHLLVSMHGLIFERMYEPDELDTDLIERHFKKDEQITIGFYE
jgi:hypothetical protein